MPSDRTVFETLAHLEGLSLQEHAAAERQAIDALDQILQTPRLGQQALRAEQPEYRDLLVSIAQLKASNTRITRTLGAEITAHAISKSGIRPPRNGASAFSPTSI